MSGGREFMLFKWLFYSYLALVLRFCLTLVFVRLTIFLLSRNATVEASTGSDPGGGFWFLGANLGEDMGVAYGRVDWRFDGGGG
jgi:hypothetical protein